MSSIESSPLAAVKNLRSKFESLAVREPPSPRQRATSNTSPAPIIETEPVIRHSSSSSDLKKRPPPPPPPRNTPRPDPALLLRVPPPPPIATTPSASVPPPPPPRRHPEEFPPPRRQPEDLPPRRQLEDLPPRRQPEDLPPRRQPEDLPPRRQPEDLPPRRQPEDSPPVLRKSFGNLPPPPTRIITPGSPLPALRRLPSPSVSSDDEDDEDEIKVDSMPDSSRSSRHTPSLSLPAMHGEHYIHVPAHHGHAVSSGTNVIVGSGHKVQIYDLAISSSPITTLDLKDCGIKGDSKISALQFRNAVSPKDKGSFLWVGTKEGHLAEIDIRAGGFTGTKLSAHIHPILFIFRYRDTMLSIDESGKVLIFEPNADATGLDDVWLAFSTPRIVRISDKIDWARMFRGVLWTASRGDWVNPNVAARMPLIRVYDILSPGFIARTVHPTEPAGSITDGALIGDRLYISHEGGMVSIWDVSTAGFLEMLKISSSDIVSLEGVNDRLWAGGRTGQITVYDVNHRPWIAINRFAAHPNSSAPNGGLPVYKIVLDPFSIDKLGRVSVLSVGRDETLRLWDGLLSWDWIQDEVEKEEERFSSERTIRVLILSWNCDSARPDSLFNGSPENATFFKDALQSFGEGQSGPDVIAIGFQEVIDLESRKMTAKNVVFSRRAEKEEGVALAGLSDKVSGAYKRWYDAFQSALRTHLETDSESWVILNTESLVGLFTCIFVKAAIRPHIKSNQIRILKRGMGGRYGNKGGILTRFIIDDTSICFINCHLAAGQSHVRGRNADLAGILEEKEVFGGADEGTGEWIAFRGGGDGRMVLDHEVVFLNGDLNYRIDARRETIINAVKANNLESLFQHDQLVKQLGYNRGFRLRGFIEGPITFPPTYKYDRRSNEYDTSEKRRSPAWCDRILVKAAPKRSVELLPGSYRRYEVDASDHRPISAAFSVNIKNVKRDIRMGVLGEVRERWRTVEEGCLKNVRSVLCEAGAL